MSTGMFKLVDGEMVELTEEEATFEMLEREHEAAEQQAQGGHG